MSPNTRNPTSSEKWVLFFFLSHSFLIFFTFIDILLQEYHGSLGKHQKVRIQRESPYITSSGLLLSLEVPGVASVGGGTPVSSKNQTKQNKKKKKRNKKKQTTSKEKLKFYLIRRRRGSKEFVLPLYWHLSVLTGRDARLPRVSCVCFLSLYFSSLSHFSYS